MSHSQIFYSHTCSFPFNHSGIPCLAIIFVSANSNDVLSDIHNEFTFGNHIFFFLIYDHFFVLPLAYMFAFFLIYANKASNCTHASIYNAHVNYVLSDSH